MKNEFPVESCRLQVPCRSRAARKTFNLQPSTFNDLGFSLVEVLLVISLLSLIVLSLTAVFSSTQRAFRASVTQTDVLEGGRMVTDLIANDLRGLTPSLSTSNFPPDYGAAVNLMVVANGSSPNTLVSGTYAPLPQTLPASTVPRTNLLSYFFILGRENTKWTGTGYIVNNAATNALYPLYRFYGETNIANDPVTLFARFNNYVNNNQWTNLSHLLDGVVHLNVRAYDPSGQWINDTAFRRYTNAANTLFLSQAYGEAQIYMFSNTVPAAVEMEIGLLENQTLSRAESRGIANTAPAYAPAQWAFLQQQSGTLHIFHRRVTVPNVDTSAYQ